MQNSEVDVYIACPACDVIHHRRKVTKATTARCSRCQTKLYKGTRYLPDRSLSFVVSGLILFFISNCYPFLTLKIEGRVQETVLSSGIIALYEQEQLSLAVLVLLTGMVFPLLQLLGMTYVLLPLRFGLKLPYMAIVYRWVRLIQPWSMMEILMLGILVSLVKLVGMAGVVTGPALYAFMALIFIFPAAAVTVDANHVWEHVQV